MGSKANEIDASEPTTGHEWHKLNRLRYIDELRQKAQRAYGQSILYANIDNQAAEQAAIKSLDLVTRAFWNAEDSELEEPLHDEMHRYGEHKRRSFGCFLAYEGGNYHQRCPIAIAHKRFGMSVGFTVKSRVCSICGDELADCEHLLDELYEVPGGIGPAGVCPVCTNSECNDHSPDRLYKVGVVGVVKEAQLHEISIVRKPSQPEARATSLPVDTRDFKEALGVGFTPGMAVTCDKCLYRPRSASPAEPDAHIPTGIPPHSVRARLSREAGRHTYEAKRGGGKGFEYTDPAALKSIRSNPTRYNLSI